MRPPLPPLSRLAIAALRVPLPETGARGLALDGPPSVPTQAKRDADGLAVDARTFLADARALVARADNEPVFEPELAEEARMLIERGTRLAADALAVDDEGRRALQAAVEEVRAALARLEALPRRVGLGVVAAAIEAVRDAMRRAARDDLTATAREDLLRQASEAERLVEKHLRYVEAIDGNPQTAMAMLEGLRDAVRRFEQPADDPLAAAVAQLEDTQAPEEADTAPAPDEAGGAPELPATQLEGEVADESRSGLRLGALRDEVVAFLRAVRAGTVASGASGASGAGRAQLTRLRTRALAFPPGPLQAALLDALALARAALEAGGAPAAPEVPAAPEAPAVPVSPPVPAPPPPAPPPENGGARDDPPMDVGDDRQAAGGEDEDERARDGGEEEDDGEPGGREGAARRGGDPAEPEDPVAPRIVGRASERGPRGAELHYFLVLTPAQRSSKRARKFEWKRRDELAAAAALAAAFDLLPAARRGSDPAGDGWVVGVTDARDGPEGREFRARWFVWAQGESAPLSKRLEWRKYADFVNPALADAFDDGLRAEAGVAEDESDDEAEAGPASAVPGFMAETQAEEVDRTAGAPSSLRWDPALGRPRLSLRAAVRNHAPEEWTRAALQSYVLTRRFVLLSRVPPKAGAPGAPTAQELRQLGEDLLFVREPKLVAQWRRARLLAKRRRQRQREAANDDDRDGPGEDDEAGSDEDEDELEQDDAVAEAAWRERTRKSLLDDAQARWSASRTAIDPELAELDAQWRALEAIGAEGRDGPVRVGTDEPARVGALVAAWADRAPDWPAGFAKPRLKLPDIGDFLSEARSQEAERWLLLQRTVHTEAAAAQRATGILGSSLGKAWPFADVPTPTEAPGEHTVPVEWYQPGCALVLENRDGRQCPVGIHISLQTENSSKGAKPVGTFSLPSESRDPKRVYATPLLAEPKRAQLAKSTAFGFLAYLGLSNKQTSKGSAPLATSSGVATYARAWAQNPDFRRLVEAAPTAWERRIQLLCLGMQWQVGNPLVLHPGVVDDALAALLGSRFKGDDPLLRLCDQALLDSVLRAPR